MKDKTFIDTNIFIYAIDSSPENSEKCEIARKLITDRITDQSGVISIQIFQEFFTVSTRKITSPLSIDEALEYLHYMMIFETVYPDFPLLEAAIRLHQRYMFSFWDALVIQSALTAGCTRLISEDLQHGMKIDTLIVDNPFK